MKFTSNRKIYVLLPLALLSALLLFVGGPGTDSLRSFRYVWGAGHLFCFALWAHLYSTWRADLSFKRLFLEILLLTFVIGGLTELIQSGIGREATWQDLGNDVIGSLIGLMFFSQTRTQLPALQLKIIQIPVFILVLWTLFPVGKVLVDDLISWQQFPLLSNFETPLEATRWNGSAKRMLSRQIHFSGQSSLQIDLNTKRYSGIGLKDFPRDWSAYKTISLQIFNPDGEPLKLHFRIHDQSHREHKNAYSDRYNNSFTLHSGWNQLEVSLADVAQAPKNRLLDLSRIAGMGVFVGKLDQPRTIYIDDVKLLL
ncbi:MAG: hypothetical protein OQK97_01905 [Deltaproteobacteria bacterium]|nr:hypothetical protein [Deltaproteobacteria bacterium]MCW8893301.1 hypothetical protein [Deltaproteobacteria bacterium]